ncbi:MAG: hypothetical protein KJT03_00485 [Verrucomicrobiae bacterium]|nr:hypothetical protein [Verrucomicrobiae bacterium]
MWGSSSASAQLPDPQIYTEQLAQIYEVDGVVTRWVLQPSGELPDSYSLRLLWVSGVQELPTTGDEIVVVALVGSAVHVRIFDDRGIQVVDKGESDLKAGQDLNEIRSFLQMTPRRNEDILLPPEIQAILSQASVVADYPPRATGPMMDSQLNPAYSDEARVEYTGNPGFFNLSSKAGYGSGLGILSESRLPPIDSLDGPWRIRSNSQVKSRWIRQFTASSDNTSEFAMDLLLAVDGSMGYRFAGNDPFAFERILDASIDLVVRVYRTDGKVETVFAAGAVLGRSEDQDLPFNAYGDWGPTDWTVSGTEATLQFFEHIDQRFTVENGETFAVEFEFTANTRNYEHPNSAAFVRMLDTADIRLIPHVWGAEVIDSSTEAGVESPLVGKVKGVAKVYSNMPIETIKELDNGSFVRRIQPLQQKISASRPPDIFPFAGLGNQGVVPAPGGEISNYFRTYASYVPNAPGVMVGVEARQDLNYTGAAIDPELPDTVSLSTGGNASSRFIAQVSGTPPESIDVDFQFLFNGVIEFRAPSYQAYNDYFNKDFSDTRGEADFELVVSLTTKSGGKSIASKVYENTRLRDYPSKAGAMPILDDQGRIVGQKLVLNVNSDTDSQHELIGFDSDKLEDVLQIKPHDFIEVFYSLEVKIISNLERDKEIEYIHIDFLDTFEPLLSTDTPGVTFILADPPTDRSLINALQVEPTRSGLIILSWPSEGVGNLQKNDSLDAGTWTTVDLPVQDNGVLKTLVLPVEEVPQFYRLDPVTPEP